MLHSGCSCNPRLAFARYGPQRSSEQIFLKNRSRRILPLSPPSFSLFVPALWTVNQQSCLSRRVHHGLLFWPKSMHPKQSTKTAPTHCSSRNIRDFFETSQPTLPSLPTIRSSFA